MRRIIRFALLLVVLVSVRASAEQSLPFATFTETTRLAGHDVRVDLYVPSAGSSQGVAILAHGFARTRVRHRDLAQTLATAGFIAVVPDLPEVLDPWRNADAIVTLAERVESGYAGFPSVPRSRMVLIGTSIGGLVTVMAAAKLPGLAGWIGLDPVDRTRSAIRAASRLTAPAVVLLAKPSFCNLYGSGSSIARALPGLLRSTVVEGASHCDFEGPTDNLCRAACGQGSEAMQSHVRDETVRAVAEMLHVAEFRRTTLSAEIAD